MLIVVRIKDARIFFENAGGSLTLKSVVETNTKLSSIPDNQGRDNPASREMVRLIDAGRADMMTFLGADDGKVFVGESGTECLFRVIRAAILTSCQNGDGAQVVGGTLEHPATASAAKIWSAQAGAEYIAVAHDPKTCALTADDYRRHVTAKTRVATVIQTSPVSGTSVDVGAVAAAIREVAPDCFIIVDGIQHAPHGGVEIADWDIDAYAVSGYKIFSRHNYGFAWTSPRLSVAPHDHLLGTADDFWELGTRDAAAYATFSEVVNYLEWLGARVGDSTIRRARISDAAVAITAHEKHLIEIMLHGTDKQKGLTAMREVFVIGGADNAHREGLVSLVVDGVSSAQVVRSLGAAGVRVHIRKNDYFSAGILTPLNFETCVRVSLCHYNTGGEVQCFLAAMEAIIAGELVAV